MSQRCTHSTTALCLHVYAAFFDTPAPSRSEQVRGMRGTGLGLAALARPPRAEQRHWLLHQLTSEWADDLEHLDTISRRMVKGDSAQLRDMHADITEAALTDQHIQLGNVVLRGEGGALRVSAAGFLRQTYNPFFDYQLGRIGQFMNLAFAPSCALQGDS